METRINEIATWIYRLSPFVPEIAAPAGFTFNQLLILGNAPPLFHCSHRGMFPLIATAVARVIPPEGLRWISLGHIKADECGAMNEWLRIAPRATITSGAVASWVWLNDMADRPPQILGDGEVVDLGGKRVRYLDTPHVSHGWQAGVLFEETTGTLLCGDLFTHTGNGPVVVTTDVVGPSMAAADMFGFNSLTPATGPTIRQLAALAPAPRH
jgi:flavorubredoxin